MTRNAALRSPSRLIGNPDGSGKTRLNVWGSTNLPPPGVPNEIGMDDFFDSQRERSALTPALPLAIVLGEEHLPQADDIGRDLNEFVVLDVFQRLFQ